MSVVTIVLQEVNDDQTGVLKWLAEHAVKLRRLKCQRTQQQHPRL